MGKKSLLSSTNKKKDDRESSEEKDNKSKALTARTKKTGKTALKKKHDMPGPGKKENVSSKDSGLKAEIWSSPLAAGATPEEAERMRQLLIETFDATYSNAEPNPARGKFSADISPPDVPSFCQSDDAGGESVHSSMESERSAPAKNMDAMNKKVIIGILGLILLLGLAMSESIKNTAKYYMKPAKGDLEIWKGKFSPMGEKKFVTLKATALPAHPKDVYGKDEIYSFILESYVDQADALLNASDMPDFELIKRTLNKASAFALSPESKKSIQRRLSKINLVSLVYKADILADKNTAADLASARDALEKAMRLDLDEAEKGLVEQKLQWIRERQARPE